MSLRMFRGCARAAAWSGLVLALLAPAPLAAQTPPPATLDSLRREIAVLRAQIDSLRSMLAAESSAARPDTAAEDALARLRAAARAAVEGGEAKEPGEAAPAPQQFVGRQRSLQALNPEISVNTDIFAFVPTESPDVNNFVPREFEFSFQAALDPFSRAKIFLSHHTGGGELVAFGEGDHGEEEGAEEHGAVEVEEGYVQWVNLPGGLGISVGRIRQRLGTLNRWHRHALPGQSLPLPYLVFTGEEGLAQTGASLYGLVPVHGFGTHEVWVELMRSSNERLFGESRKPSVLAHYNAFWELSPATYLEVGLSGVAGRYQEENATADVQLFQIESAFNWRPPERALYREFTLRGALLFHRRDPLAAAAASAGTLTTMGAYALGELRFARQWVVGLRYETVENPDVAGERAWLVAPTLTWWQSEWVRLRAEYDLLSRPDETVGQFLIQFTFAMGPHKHETY